MGFVAAIDGCATGCEGIVLQPHEKSECFGFGESVMLSDWFFQILLDHRISYRMGNVLEHLLVCD